MLTGGGSANHTRALRWRVGSSYECKEQGKGDGNTMSENEKYKPEGGTPRAMDRLGRDCFGRRFVGLRGYVPWNANDHPKR